MKRIIIALVNIIIMASILVFVVLYSRYENNASFQRQVAHFENTTVTMEQVTENYLEGEQRICDVWAQYINSMGLTMEEATEYIRSSHVLAFTSAHLVDESTLTGLSTRPRQGTSDDYEVSYDRVGILKDVNWIDEVGNSINITRAYTNPMNGEQSLAFCNHITLHDAESGNSYPAVLLRVIPISELEQKWVFPEIELAHAELSIIDTKGDYILKGYNFKNSSFLEFYKSYNPTDPESAGELLGSITSATGHMQMLNSHGDECILAFTPVSATAGWTLLGLVPASDLDVKRENWILFGFVFLGLLILFLTDLFYVFSLNNRLKITAREAESASKAKTDFLSTMSHDIRTPMNAIIGLTSITEQNLDDKALAADNLRKISLASNHLLTLINDILDISKVESGKLALVPMTFSIMETVENLKNISQPMIKEKNIDFSFNTEGIDKEYLYADQLRLNQIYINILSNAIKYTEPGGSVSARLSEDKSEKEGCVLLTYTVSDTGIGMSPEFMANMYQPFSRQVDSRVNSIQGTGLGLAITKQMVELLGGTIECESEQGKGTTFTIRLDIPVADKQAEERELRPDDDNSDLQGMHILVAEDNDINWEIISYMLSTFGIEADRAENGRICLEKISAAADDSYDLIFMDVQMPEMNGLDATRAIRKLESPWASSVPIIAMTADAFAENVTECLNAGMNGHIAKPIDVKLVVREIRRIKEEKRKP